MPNQKITTRAIALLATGWLITAWVLGWFGVIASLRPPVPQGVLFGLVAVLILTFHTVPGFRNWLLSRPIENLVAFHIVRLVGAYFLSLHQQGRLPFAFAVPGGIGDIIIAIAAICIVIFRRRLGPAVILVWNVAGLLEILFVVVTAARLARRDFDSMVELVRLPLSLLPTFVVPLILFTHYVIFFRLMKNRPGQKEAWQAN